MAHPGGHRLRSGDASIRHRDAPAIQFAMVQIKKNIPCWLTEEIGVAAEHGITLSPMFVNTPGSRRAPFKVSNFRGGRDDLMPEVVVHLLHCSRR